LALSASQLGASVLQKLAQSIPRCSSSADTWGNSGKEKAIKTKKNESNTHNVSELQEFTYNVKCQTHRTKLIK